MLYFNARSVAQKQSELTEYVDYHNADIVGITETWLKDNINFTAFTSNFNVFRNDRPSTLGQGGGSLLAVNSKFHCNLVKKCIINRCECLFVDVQSNNAEFTRYALIYRPPDTNHENSVELFNVIHEYLKEVKLYVLCGDFNLPDISWDTLTARSPVSREFLTMCFRLGSEQYVNFPTRNDHVLDLVLCPSRQMLSSVICEAPFSSSDHVSILCKVNSPNSFKHEMTSKPCFKKANYQMINAFLTAVDWDMVYANCESPNEYWLAFKNVINTAIFNFVPFVQPGTRKTVPWFSNKLKHLRSVKQRKWNKYVNSRNIVTMAQYKDSASKFRKEFLKVKCDYEKKLFSADNSNGKFYAYVKRHTSAKYSIPSLKCNDGSLAVTDYDKACEFGKYFESVFVRDNGTIPNFETNCTDRLDNFTCDPRNVIKIVKKLKSSSSAGPDGINVYFIKQILAVVTNPLCKVYNISLSEGVVPDEWKIAHITPVFKKGNSQLPSQYRPISLTSVICKILERIVREKLLDYLLKNRIIPKDQHGFVPKKSTITNMLECLNNWSLNFDKKLNTDIIYLDYSKCFDTVCHSKLLHKLDKYGIQGSAYKWLESFLVNRVQQVKINNSLSPPLCVESGVPQGTVLGPILFLIYSADLPEVVENCKISIYADDTKIYKSIKAESDCLKLQTDLDNVSKWADMWQMTLNPEKTKVLTIGNKKVDFDYVLNGIRVEKVNHIKDVGVIIQSNLKFTMQCSNVVKKAYFVIRNIFTTFKGHDCDFYSKMYTCYVRPQLEYACQVWSPHLKTNIDRIESVQRYYTRRICPNNTPYLERLTFLNIKTLENRRICSDLTMFYKVINNVTCVDVQEYYSFVNRSRGHSKHLFMYYSRTNIRKFFWVNRIVPFWNNLTDDIVCSRNMKTFKRKVNLLNSIVGRGSIYVSQL